ENKRKRSGVVASSQIFGCCRRVPTTPGVRTNGILVLLERSSTFPTLQTSMVFSEMRNNSAAAPRVPCSAPCSPLMHAATLECAARLRYAPQTSATAAAFGPWPRASITATSTASPMRRTTTRSPFTVSPNCGAVTHAIETRGGSEEDDQTVGAGELGFVGS